MKRILPFFITALLAFSGNHLKGQGCSDAGFCTLNSFKPKNADTVAMRHNQIKIGLSYGSADYSINVFGTYLEYNRQLGEKFGMDVKITTLSQSGDDASVSGLSDVYVTANYQANKRIKLSVGAKLPLADGNVKEDNLPLPMDYQSSLGTFDLIAGVGYDLRPIQIAIALQQPLSQNNNMFLRSSFASRWNKFNSTNQFKRSGDVLLRVSWLVRLGNKFRITPSLLPIYHLDNDRYTNNLGVEDDISGSRGLTLNGNAYFDYEINEKNALQLNAGIPFVVRDSRPDGLTRSFVANLEYRVRF